MLLVLLFTQARTAEDELSDMRALQRGTDLAVWVAGVQSVFNPVRKRFLGRFSAFVHDCFYARTIQAVCDMPELTSSALQPATRCLKVNSPGSGGRALCCALRISAVQWGVEGGVRRWA